MMSRGLALADRDENPSAVIVQFSFNRLLMYRDPNSSPIRFMNGFRVNLQTCLHGKVAVAAWQGYRRQSE